MLFGGPLVLLKIDGRSVELRDNLALNPFLSAIIFPRLIGVEKHSQVSLGIVMVAAMTLNLMLAALMGVLIPMTMLKLGRDPAVGSSVMITAVTDSGGFFIFLGLATLFLV